MKVDNLREKKFPDYYNLEYMKPEFTGVSMSNNY